MNNKTRIIYDNSSVSDHLNKRKPRKGGYVTAVNHETGEVIFKQLPNKVMVAGSAFTVAKVFGITPPVLTQTYNNYLGLDNTVNEAYLGDGVRDSEKICLWCVGTDGCGSEMSQIYTVDPARWIDRDNIIPFRYQNINNDLQDELRTKYFGRKQSNGMISYYFKAFEGPAVFKQQYTDGTPIDTNLYDVEKKDEIESYVEFKLSLTKEDCRDWFISTVGIKQARINSISLCTAYPKYIDGILYYQDVRPFTKYHFSTESLYDISKGIDFTYQLYY